MDCDNLKSRSKNLALLLLVTSFVLISCQKRAQLLEEGSYLVLTDQEANIESVEDVVWKVGPGFKTSISRGMRVKVRVPVLGKDEILALEKNKADSWALRVSRQTMRKGTDVLGHIIVPFYAYVNNERVIRSQTPENVIFQVYYTAALMADRMLNPLCPPFGHRKQLDNFSLGTTRESDPMISWVVVPGSKLELDIYKAQLSPVTFNVGENLVGNYTVELALYNTQTGFLYSSFKPIGPQIKVESEKNIPIKDCPQDLEPRVRDLKTQEAERIDKFKFGR